MKIFVNFFGGIADCIKSKEVEIVRSFCPDTCHNSRGQELDVAFEGKEFNVKNALLSMDKCLMHFVNLWRLWQEKFHGIVAFSHKNELIHSELQLTPLSMLAIT